MREFASFLNLSPGASSVTQVAKFIKHQMQGIAEWCSQMAKFYCAQHLSLLHTKSHHQNHRKKMFTSHLPASASEAASSH